MHAAGTDGRKVYARRDLARFDAAFRRPPPLPPKLPLSL